MAVAPLLEALDVVSVVANISTAITIRDAIHAVRAIVAVVVLVVSGVVVAVAVVVVLVIGSPCLQWQSPLLLEWHRHSHLKWLMLLGLHASCHLLLHLVCG